MNYSEVLYALYGIIEDRKKNPKEGSYTSYLFEKGMDKILKKVGEETTETIIAAKNNDKTETIYELCDLIYHVSVLMRQMNITWDEVFEELAKRELKENNLKKFNTKGNL